MHFHPGFGRAAKGEAIASANAVRSKRWWVECSDDHRVVVDGDARRRTVRAPTALPPPGGVAGGGVWDVVDVDDDDNDDNDGVVVVVPGPGTGDDVATTTISGDHGARRAERLLDWAVSSGLVAGGIFDPDPSGDAGGGGGGGGGGAPNGDHPAAVAASPNSVCVNIVETYLLPAAYGGAGGAVSSAATTIDVVDDYDNNRVTLAKRRAVVDPAIVRAVADAGRVMRKMKHLHATYPECIFPDSLSVKAELNVWSKRAALLLLLGGEGGGRMKRNDASERGGGGGGGGSGGGGGASVGFRVVASTADGVGGGGGGGGFDVVGVGVGDPGEMLRLLERRDASSSADGRYGCDEKCDRDDDDDDGGRRDCDGDDHYRLPYGPDAYTSRGCIERMESILADAESRYHASSSAEEEAEADDGGGGSMRPCSDWYNHVLGAWARSDDAVAASRRTREILSGMEVYADSGGEGGRTTGGRYLARPDTVSYNIALYCLARGGGGGSGGSNHGDATAREVESMFRGLESRYRRTRDPTIRPDAVTYGVVLHALARAGMAREAEKILDMLEDEEQKRREQHHDTCDDDEGGEAAVVPSLTIYNTVLNAWANSRRRDAPARAESLLERMRILSSTGRNPGIEPDSISVSTVISCHARSRTRRGAERGERMLDDAIDMYSKGNSRVKPDSIMFNCAITGEKSGDF